MKIIVSSHIVRSVGVVVGDSELALFPKAHAVHLNVLIYSNGLGCTCVPLGSITIEKNERLG
jgi:hypothetical protein